MFKKFFVFVLLIGSLSCSRGQKQAVEHKSMSIATNDIAIDTSWVEKVNHTDSEWKKILTPKQYYILREHGTERPYSSEYYENHDNGVFICAGCKNPLFGSATKFNSGTGWPSYYKPYSSKSVHTATDNSMGMVRDEISCQRCGGHLGHVFDDGPAPTGLRYCIDGDALLFVKAQKLSKMVIAQGCFWCVEEIYESIKGVISVTSGYAGGKEGNPSYKQVGSGETGHAEAVEVIYDSLQISFDDLLNVYFHAGDITQANGQGNDIGKQYRSIVFYSNEVERKMASDWINKLNLSGAYSKKLAIELSPLTTFYKAEEYHQDYVKHNPNDPYVRGVSIPRYKKAITHFPDLLKK